MLQKMGFRAKWIKWVSFCVSTVKFSVLVNRSPYGFFPSQRALRQGDPLSPFLFILAMEGLNNLMHTTKLKGWIRGFQVDIANVNDLEITHLHTLIFCEAARE